METAATGIEIGVMVGYLNGHLRAVLVCDLLVSVCHGPPGVNDGKHFGSIPPPPVRGADLTSDVFPFGRLGDGEPAIAIRR
jgi:hypothetical protein